MRRLALLSALLAPLLLSGCLSRGDAIAPIVTVTDPPSGAVRSVVNSTVRGYAMDDEGIVSLRVGNAELLSDPGYRGERGKKLIEFGFRINPTSSGAFRSTIVAEDASGRSTVVNYELQIDTTPPTLELREVARLDGGRVRVSGTARDNDQVKAITVAGQAVPFVPAPEKEFSLEVTPGENPVILVEDRAGNRYSQPLEP